MNRRQRKRMQQQQQSAAQVPAEEQHRQQTIVPPAKPKRAFRARTLPLNGGFDVKIAGKDAFEADIVIKYEDDLIVIATGAAAEAIRLARNPLASLVQTRPADQAPGWSSPRGQGSIEAPKDRVVPRHGNADTFVSSSKLPVYAGGGEEETENVIPMQQENGMPRSPRDRTRAQRRSLVVNDDKGNPALVVELEKLANLK
jgi:hypothetical protein